MHNIDTQCRWYGDVVTSPRLWKMGLEQKKTIVWTMCNLHCNRTLCSSVPPWREDLFVDDVYWRCTDEKKIRMLILCVHWNGGIVFSALKISRWLSQRSKKRYDRSNLICSSLHSSFCRKLPLIVFQQWLLTFMSADILNCRVVH